MGGLSRIRLDGLANNSVANTNIVDGAVGAAEIATGAVKQQKLLLVVLLLIQHLDQEL